MGDGKCINKYTIYIYCIYICCVQQEQEWLRTATLATTAATIGSGVNRNNRNTGHNDNNSCRERGE